MIGHTLSHYRITAALGAGGMGEVYRATDTKLGRDVAIKVLPAEMATDAGRLERFQREAHLLAALNHPHIAAIHGLEEADGQPFLVLELVEGEDLKERLVRGAIPVDEALEIAVQVAEALEEAHNTGIVHRDLKPANVKVTPDGRVKVLDFGLAKAWAGDSVEGKASSDSMSQSPTLAHSGTQAGVILGTAAYMSPEQARGKPVDKRGDVWAFGVLLWEMLTGRALFAGDTVTDIIAAVVKEEPDLDALPPATPPAVRRLIARCLRKDPRARIPDIGGARLELQDVLTGTASETESLAGPSGEAVRAERGRRTKERWVLAGFALAAAGVAATLAFIHWTEIPEPKSAARFVVDAPEGLSFRRFQRPVPSPDGSQIVIPLQDEVGNAAGLWLRSLESLTGQKLTGTEGAWHPFWSPDSRFVGFFVAGELRKINVADGVVQPICRLPGSGFAGADWSEAGTILFGVRGSPSGGIYTVAATGGEAKPLLAADATRGEMLLVAPQFLPDGRRFLFTVIAEAGSSLGTFVGSLDSPDERRLLLPDTINVQQADGHLLFNREGTLLAQPFDAERGQVTGEPVAIASSVALSRSINVVSFGVSPGGTIAYLSGEDERRIQLTWLDRKGKQLGTLGAPGPYSQLALSPDDRRVAVEVRDPASDQFDLWVIDVSRDVMTRLTSDPGDERDPVWSPDGQEVAYGAFARGRGLGLFRKGLTGEPASPIPIESEANAEFRPMPDSWSSDGKTLLYKRLFQNKAWAFPLEGGGEAEVVLDLEAAMDEPQVSPDGRWLAYTSQESGEYDVYVQPFRQPGERVRVSRHGGGPPKWRGDGKELFYQAPDGMLMAVEVGEGTAGPAVTPPTALFDAGTFDVNLDYFAASSDGQRFLVRQPTGSDRKVQMHVISNWTSLLESGQ